MNKKEIAEFVIEGITFYAGMAFLISLLYMF